MKNGTLGILRKFLRARHYAENEEGCRLTGSYPDPALQARTAPWRFVFNTKKQFFKRHFIHPALRARRLTGGAFLIPRRRGVAASCAGASGPAGRLQGQQELRCLRKVFWRPSDLSWVVQDSGGQKRGEMRLQLPGGKDGGREKADLWTEVLKPDLIFQFPEGLADMVNIRAPVPRFCAGMIPFRRRAVRFALAPAQLCQGVGSI